MSTIEELTVNGVKYATPAIAAKARRDAEALQKRVAEAKAKRAADFEWGMKDRFMATPGATEEQWTKEREGILAEARRKAALEGDDAARRSQFERMRTVM
jgi:hypothetical protein